MNTAPTPAKLKVAVLTKSFGKESPLPVRYLEEHGCEVCFRWNDAPEREERVAELIGDAQAAIVSAADRVGRLVFERCANLRVIADHAVGMDRIDLEAAARSKVKVFTCPGNHESVADLTLALILAACRNLYQAFHSVKEGGWETPSFSGSELSSRTIGIVGYGKIGRAVAIRAAGFGSRVLAYDPYIDAIAPVQGTELQWTDLDALLQESDIVTLHVPLSKETDKLIDAAAISKMKDGAIVVNTSRGGLIDEEALYQALLSGKLSMAALDVLEQEPPLSRRLIGLEHVILTPHIGARTADANLKMGMLAARGIVDALRGRG